MELLHRQEELEHAELEKALLMSLAVEEDRLSQLMAEMKNYDRSLTNDSDSDAKDFVRVLADAKESKATSRTFAPVSSLSDAKALPAVTFNRGGGMEGGDNDDDNTTSGLKPLKGLRAAGLKPLPSIGGGAAGNTGASALQELQEKKRQTEEALRRGQEQLAAQRRSEEELRQQLQGIAPKEADERARHMQQQRELLLAKKKEERDKKAHIEDERRRKADSDGGKESGDGLRGLDLLKQSSSAAAASAEDSKAINDEVADMRRATMRMALARRLKLDVSAEADAKQLASHEDEAQQYAAVDQRLAQMEQLREDNRKKEYQMARQLERQKEQIARNIELSAMQLDKNVGSGKG